MKFVPRRLERTADLSRGARGGWDTVLGGAQVLMAAAVLYGALGLLAEVAAEHVPTSWESRFAWTPDLGEARNVAEVDAGRERVEAVLRRLLAVADVRPLPYRAVVLEQEAANAFAIPGGAVVVTTGLLAKVHSDQGLAMVIGHELGHHDARHVLKRTGRALLIVAPVVLLVGEAAGPLGHLLALGEGKYSRDQEREADEIGLAMVFAAYGHTDGALEFFEGLADREGEWGAWTALAASHPPTVERVEALQRQAESLRREVRPGG